MNISKVIRRRIRSKDRGVDLAGDVNAVISTNVGKRGSVTRTSSRQRVVARSDASETTKEE